MLFPKATKHVLPFLAAIAIALPWHSSNAWAAEPLKTQPGYREMMNTVGENILLQHRIETAQLILGRALEERALLETRGLISDSPATREAIRGLDVYIAEIKQSIHELSRATLERAKRKGGGLGILGAAVIGGGLLRGTSNAMAAQDPGSSPILSSGAVNQDKKRRSPLLENAKGSNDTSAAGNSVGTAASSAR